MNVDFSVVPASPFDLRPLCTYCDRPFNREKMIKIKFDTMRALYLHIDECWDNFVVGVSIINDQLTALTQN